MSISREFVGTPTSTVGTSVTHQPAKARLEPRLGLGPAATPTPPTPRQLLAKCLSPSSTPKKAWVPCSEWRGGKDSPHTHTPTATSSWKPPPTHAFPQCGPNPSSEPRQGRPYLRTRPSLPRYDPHPPRDHGPHLVPISTPESPPAECLPRTDLSRLASYQFAA